MSNVYYTETFGQQPQPLSYDVFTALVAKPDGERPKHIIVNEAAVKLIGADTQFTSVVDANPSTEQWLRGYIGFGVGVSIFQGRVDGDKPAFVPVPIDQTIETLR